jgi:hypothetical protein
MNNKLDIELFFNLRYNEHCLNLDSEIIESIVDTFSNNKFKKGKVPMKKTIAVIKNPKLKQIKDKISNRVNLILNKLSENNIENLVFEFVENIKILNNDDYNEFLRSFYIKILSEISFFKFYLKFFHAITSIYEKVNNFSIEYFFNLIEYKFNYDYYDDTTIITNNPDLEFLKDMDDEKRINNLTLLNELIKVKYFKESFYDFIGDKLLNQKKYLSDIYYWFKDKTLTNNTIEKINIILTEDIQLRDKVLLDNLLSGKSTIELNQPPNKIIFKKPTIKEESPKNPSETNAKLTFSEALIIDKKEQKQSTDNVELENNLEEYLFIENSESLEDYIYNNCKDANTKNKFCEFIIDKYFKLSPNESQKILYLMKKLVKSKILFKSNLSRGLLNLYGTKNTYNQDKFKKLLMFLKNLGITNGLETLMNKYKIDLTLNL